MSKPVAIPFNETQASGLDPLSGVGELQRNFIPDAAGGLRQRFGIRPWADFPTTVTNTSPIVGIFPWRQWVLFVREDRTIAAVEAPGSVIELSDATAATQLDGTLRPVWTYDQERVVVTGGGAPQKWEGAGLSSRLAPGAVMPDGSPLALTHIGYSAQRLVGNDNNNSGTWQWTPPGPGDHSSWPIVGAFFQEAEASPDPLVALYVNSNEVFLFGKETTQVYIPDATAVFAVATVIQVGTSSPYSVITTDAGDSSWLDENQRFVTSAGRNFKVISEPSMSAAIKALTNVSDCWGCNIKIGPSNLLVWTFDTDKRTFFYDKVTKKWGEFGTSTPTGGNDAWLPNCYTYLNSPQNLHLVGLDDGTIGELTYEAVDDNGTPIKAVSRTGFQDHGTFARKNCQRVQMQMRRGGTTPPGPAPVVEIRYRDDLGAFRPVLRWSMGIGGDYQPVVDRWSCGIYRQREWELEWSGGAGFIMTGATESIELSDT
jgi:hypothetical protein